MSRRQRGQGITSTTSITSFLREVIFVIYSRDTRDTCGTRDTLTYGATSLYIKLVRRISVGALRMKSSRSPKVMVG